MIININEFKNKLVRNELSHVFVLNNPISVFIAKIIIESNNIPEDKIYLISFRKINIDVLNGNKISIKLNFIDKLFRKIFLFSLQGFRLRKTIEKKCGDFLLYCDWDNRDVVEIMNSKRYKGHAYIEEGQSAFNPFKEYHLKKNRLSQYKRLRRWQSSSNLKDQLNLDIHTFKEFFNKDAFAFFTIINGSYPLINPKKRILLKDFSYVKNVYKPQLLGIKNIGIMCSPRRLKNDWTNSIYNLINSLPNNSVIKLHPEFYSNKHLLDKFLITFENLNDKKHIKLCSNNILIEAEMLFEKKYLYGPLTSLIKYAQLFGSEFKKVNIY